MTTDITGTEIRTQNSRGEWVPAIPLPTYTGFRLKNFKCGECDRIFSRDEEYQGHYALVHVLGLGASS